MCGDTHITEIHISLWPACLQSWPEFNFAGKPAVVGDCRRWKYFMWTPSGPSADPTYDVTTLFFPTIPFFTDEIVENCANSICISRQFEYVGDPSPMGRGPTGTDRRTLHLHLQPATTLQVGRRHMRTRLYRRYHNLLNIWNKFQNQQLLFYFELCALLIIHSSTLDDLTWESRKPPNQSEL